MNYKNLMMNKILIIINACSMSLDIKGMFNIENCFKAAIYAAFVVKNC